MQNAILYAQEYRARAYKTSSWNKYTGVFTDVIYDALSLIL